MISCIICIYRRVYIALGLQTRSRPHPEHVWTGGWEARTPNTTQHLNRTPNTTEQDPNTEHRTHPNTNPNTFRNRTPNTTTNMNRRFPNTEHCSLPTLSWSLQEISWSLPELPGASRTLLELPRASQDPPGDSQGLLKAPRDHPGASQGLAQGLLKPSRNQILTQLLKHQAPNTTPLEIHI